MEGYKIVLTEEEKNNLLDILTVIKYDQNVPALNIGDSGLNTLISKIENAQRKNGY